MSDARECPMCGGPMSAVKGFDNQVWECKNPNCYGVDPLNNKQLDAIERYRSLRDREDGCICQECGVKFREDVVLSDDLWERIKPADKPPGGGLLCGVCIGRKLSRLSLAAHDDAVKPWREALEKATDCICATCRAGHSPVCPPPCGQCITTKPFRALLEK